MWFLFRAVAHVQRRYESRPERGGGEAVATPADQVAERVARGGVERQERDVDGHHQRPDAHAEPVGPSAGQDHVVRQEDDEEQRQVEEVAVQVLEDQEPRLPLVFPARWKPQKLEGSPTAHATGSRKKAR